jgi:O-antigen/teichoic acid export membrane protein
MKRAATKNFKKRTINSSVWVTAGYGLQQVLRFASNIILTRLLFPEAFGLMAIIQTIMFGLAMLSDIGIAPSIIHNKRGNEPVFLNTAWTVHVAQGFMVFFVILGLTPFFADFYDQPMLLQLLPVVGFSAIITGFNSTKLATANRDLLMAKVTILELVTYIISLIVTVLLAWVYKSVWALVWGVLVGAFLKALASHFYLPGPHNRFAWEKPALIALFSFGGWIFLSSGLTFISGEGIKLIVAKFMDVRMLAFYTLASTMSLVFWNAMQTLAGRVFFPAYSEVLREHPEKMHGLLTKARLIMIGSGGLCALFFVFFGDIFMRFVYDARYVETGVMLQILAMGTLASVVVGSYSGVFFAKGLVATSTLTQAIQAVVQIAAIFIGAYYYQERGVILALAAIHWLVYPVYAYFLHTKAGLWQPKIDLPFLAVSAVISYFVFNSLHYV